MCTQHFSVVTGRGGDLLNHLVLYSSFTPFLSIFVVLLTEKYFRALKKVSGMSTSSLLVILVMCSV